MRHGLDTVAPTTSTTGCGPSRAAEATPPSGSPPAGCAVRAPHRRGHPGPNLEARARAARRGACRQARSPGTPPTTRPRPSCCDLLRGSGGDGLSGIEPGPAHPILALRRSETEAVVRELGDRTRRDDRPTPRRRCGAIASATNCSRCERHRRRDLTPILARTAGLLRDDGAILDQLAAAVDPTDAVAVAQTPPAIARRALRRWLTVDGYPPDAASIERVLAVARGEAVACELSDGRRVERSRQRFRIVQHDQ